MTTVQLQKIDQSFGRLNVLQGLDLQVESGQYLVLLGASGGGKTTTLRIIAGLQNPDAGAVLLDGVDVTNKPPRARDVAMVFQHDALYPHLTVEGSIGFALKKQIPRSEISQRVSDAARLTGIESQLDRLPHHLSGGQLRRAAIAKAIARQSGVRLLDEPLSSLDGQARESLQSDILSWHRSLGGTTIHVTHDGQEAMRMADVIAVLSDGRIDQCAQPSDIYRQPATLAVARAIGSPSIQCFDAICQQGSCVLTHQPDAVCKIALDDRNVKSLVIAVRPESLRIAKTEASESNQFAICVPGVLQRIAPVGRDLMMTVQCGEQSVTAFARADDEVSFSAGDQVRVCAEPEHLHLFDAESGQRL